MGWGYRKRKQILPGVWLNFSKRGISTTIGKRGASVNFGSSGTYLNLGIPGTGIYSRGKISSSKKRNKDNRSDDEVNSNSEKSNGCSIGCIIPLFGIMALLAAIMTPFNSDFIWDSENANTFAIMVAFSLVCFIIPAISFLISGKDEGIISIGTIAEGCLSNRSCLGSIIKFFGCYSLVQVFLMPILCFTNPIDFKWNKLVLLYLLYLVCSTLIIIIPFIKFVSRTKNKEDSQEIISESTSSASTSSRVSSFYTTSASSSPGINDDLFLRIAEFVVTKRRVNVPLIQSEFMIDSNTAHEIINKLEKMRIIGVEIGLTPRHILVKDLDELRDLIDRQKRQEQSDSTINGPIQP